MAEMEMNVFLMILIGSFIITIVLEAMIDFTRYQKEDINQEHAILTSLRARRHYLKTKPLIKGLLLATVWIQAYSNRNICEGS